MWSTSRSLISARGNLHNLHENEVHTIVFTKLPRGIVPLQNCYQAFEMLSIKTVFVFTSALFSCHFCNSRHAYPYRS